ncbi:hypothetical protein, variant [Sphaeroforma arctica JP610]|uniref:Uncharacterized protein n=1 Tax=Sphaeroforma arctica JP610 TaxID=667725 RepID=A0A0L0FNA8_9EUKA|nr:hypothetical protein, variant [Sphaeroforma arctica JP610]KNC78280.1 hypothetical protein, variant [Sphaeroforma arctica JP610]|eukprot:XP_014152182.1 hypothetical protein, variant [Sphaeroforma arctica JP610]
MADRTRVYFVCGQAMTDGRTTVRGVYHATQHFLAKAIPDEQRLMGSGKRHFLVKAIPDEQRIMGSGKRVVLWLPLLSAGDGGLNQHYVLNTMLNAIGNYASSEGWAGVVHIKISLGSKPENLGQSIPIRYDVMTGRLPVGDILSRGSKGKMEFTCVAHDTRRGWIVQHVQIDIRGTFEHLRVAMGLDELPFGYHANERLIECDITDGKVVQLLDKSHGVSRSFFTVSQCEGDGLLNTGCNSWVTIVLSSARVYFSICRPLSLRLVAWASDSIPATDIEAENSSTLMRSGSPFVPLTSLGDTGAARADTKEYESHHSPVSEQHPLRYDTTHTPGKQITCDTTHTPGKQTTDYPIHTPGKPITGHRVPVHASTEGGMVLAIDSRDRIVPNSGTRVVQMNEQSSSVDTEISPTSAEVAVSPFLPKSDKGCYGTSENGQN